MTILVAGGDSFVWGSELSDYSDVHGSKLTFPALLAKNNNLEYLNVSHPGNSNPGISRMTMTQCCELKKQNKDFVVLVSWTFDARYEFRFNYDTEQRISPWYSINSWTQEHNSDNLIDEFNTTDEEYLETLTSNIKRANKTGVAEFARCFYKHVGNSEYYEIYSTLKEIVFMQNYLKVHNVPYLFTTADWQQENYDRRKDTILISLFDQIDWNCWYLFPPGDSNDGSQTNKPRGFYQWAVENKYKIGASHPLEDAHHDASLLLQEKFNELVKKSI